MGKEYQEIDERIGHWIARQKMFFVATAPRADNGLINCSPKGMDSLRVLGPRRGQRSLDGLPGLNVEAIT